MTRRPLWSTIIASVTLCYFNNVQRSILYCRTGDANGLTIGAILHSAELNTTKNVADARLQQSPCDNDRKSTASAFVYAPPPYKNKMK